MSKFDKYRTSSKFDKYRSPKAVGKETQPSFLDRVSQFGKGALAGFMRSGLAEGADQFGAGVMEVAPGVVAPIQPDSAKVMRSRGPLAESSISSTDLLTPSSKTSSVME